MEIKEAIQHCREVANRATTRGECPECAVEHEQLVAWLEELEAYRAAMPLGRAQELAKSEKEGRLVVLAVNPYLKPEQTNEVFICENGGVWPIYVTGCEVGPNSEGRLAVIYETVDGDVFCDTDIGKTVFLTRQEAEEALREEAEHG